MTKKQRAEKIIDLLEKEYPLADCTLDYDEAWKLLVSVRLAAQCTDARVNVVVKDLFAKYPSPAALAAATPEEIEADVRKITRTCTDAGIRTILWNSPPFDMTSDEFTKFMISPVLTPFSVRSPYSMPL